MTQLKIENLGPIEKVDIELGDLTFFVGPQASGKSITLETLKLIEDRDSIIETLDRFNYIIGHDFKRILNVYYGEGMAGIWTDKTNIKYDNQEFNPNSLIAKVENRESTVFYVPAQRIICMGDGYPRFFSDFSFTTPYVLREFTETLRALLQFGLGNNEVIFPLKGTVGSLSKNLLDKSIFHDGEVIMAEVAGQHKLQLEVDDLKIPFMAWSAGQKEFIPLLLGFYCLHEPPAMIVRRKKYKAVIIEEPEMGLHPKAIIDVLLRILDLVSAGYKVIVSTHSSIFIEFAWAFNTLKGHSRNFREALCTLFRVEAGSGEAKILEEMVEKSVRTIFFSRNGSGSKVRTEDISSLDVMSEDIALSEWGGISEFASRANEVISEYYE